jgi:hypothetical protein
MDESNSSSAAKRDVRRPCARKPAPKLLAHATASGINAKQQNVAMTNGFLPVCSAIRAAGM